jgi:hypothetical protein
MPLVTENVIKNAEKCKRCAFLKLRSTAIEKTDVLYDEASVALEVMYRASCNMCPNGKDFEKVFGVKPFEYFPPQNTPVGEKK